MNTTLCFAWCSCGTTFIAADRHETWEMSLEHRAEQGREYCVIVKDRLFAQPRMASDGVPLLLAEARWIREFEKLSQTKEK